MEYTPTLRSVSEQYFPNFDIVLGEGFSQEKEVAKIAVLRKDTSDYIKSPRDDILALVSDSEIKADKPVFKSNDVSGLADCIEPLLVQEDKVKSSVTLIINGKPIPMKSFVQNVLKNVIMGVVATLRRKNGALKQIDVTINLEDDA